MRMQKEEKIVIVLLLMALGSLTTAFLAFSSAENEMSASPGSVSPGFAAAGSSQSRYLTIEGTIIQKESTKSGGNLILRLDSTPMPVFIPASAGSRELAVQLREGGMVRITGTVTEYQGEDELKVSHKADVQLLGV